MSSKTSACKLLLANTPELVFGITHEMGPLDSYESYVAHVSAVYRSGRFNVLSPNLFTYILGVHEYCRCVSVLLCLECSGTESFTYVPIVVIAPV